MRTRMRIRRLAALATLSLGALSSRPALAWDPSTTHVAMTREAVLRSGMHVRWMDQSNLTRGLFTAVRIHPGDLDPETRRAIRVAVRRVHAASGGAPLGGPGACPGPSAPASTQVRCVEGDVWEMTALGWIQLGVVLETTPRNRLLHHFASGTDAAAVTWADPELPGVVLRSKARHAEDPIARAANGSEFSGGGTSAVAWLSDRTDPWAPPATLGHLQAAETAATARERDRELGLGLIGLGALLHVVQDQSVPAHARGDLTAFFAPLSPTPGDRGLPLQEYVRVLYGRSEVPAALPLSPRDTSLRVAPLAPTLHQHLLGAGDYPGLTRFTQAHFWSESSLPEPRHLDTELDPAAAASALLGEDHGLDATEVDGATLVPWPASSGYLRSSSGRGLAAFDTDEEGRTRLFLDRRVYRDQAAHLIPAGIEASASVLDLLFPAFPAHDVDFDAGVVDVDLGAGPFEPVLTILTEDAEGGRTVVQRMKLRPGQRNHIVDAFPAPLPDDVQLLLRVEGTSAPTHGVPQVATTVARRPVVLPQPEPAPKPEPEPQPAPEPAEVPADAVPVESGRGPSESELISPYGDETKPTKNADEGKKTPDASPPKADDNEAPAEDPSADPPKDLAGA